MKEMIRIEVLGPGCPKCDNTYDKVRQVLNDLKMEAELVKVTDVFRIIDRGVSLTPALIIDGKVVLQGRMPAVEQIREILQGQGAGGKHPTTGSGDR
jgi:small redox-active disulfide protein 2